MILSGVEIKKMMQSHRVLKFALLVWALLAFGVSLAWNVPQPSARRIVIQGFAQGTTYQLIYYAADSIVSQGQTDSLLKVLDRSVSLYLPTSLICSFNHSAKGITIDEHFRVLVTKALEISRATGAAADITVKPLVDAWGFGADKPEAVPDQEKIRSILRNVGPGKIWLEGNVLHKKSEGVEIDLNGIAQGYSADLLAGLLEDHHIFNYLVEIGGELRIKGQKPDGEQFRIGIEAIEGNDFAPAPFRKIISPGDGAVTTSGNYRKHLQSQGKQISHIINAQTGYPAANEMISVTVWAKDGITADGYDNAFMVMGLKQTLRFLEKRTDMAAYIIYKKGNGAVADTVTKGFKGYDID